ncbi:rhodanese-like domain-containing protein [Pedobacter sp. SD-b]|uniref:Rhodanese-like domain-containing protein n=1 Tax=Pedobacter segetis TaxID=2793069 RepID=A0ABS1BMS6_9SPHI|nr:rhodanese-like domain-containing protein [Pedobacter segetis]MBK0383499.1 rhodanese-like domain-containing protein [Pedobacter segetis]
MFKKLWTLIVLISPFASFAQIKDPEFKDMLDNLYDHSAPLISVDSLKHLKNVYLLDAREKEEFEVSHIKNARNVGYIWFDMRKVYDIPKDANIVVYCSVGYRSEKIASKLIKDGYKNVHNLYGSIFEWVNEGNPVYKSNGVQTSEIHTYNKKWSKWVTQGTKVY